jgi:hypothetical protein
MSYLELNAAKAALSLSGLLGAKAVHALDVDKVVTSTNMIVGAYVIAAQPVVPARITVSHTAVGAVDTLGTINIVGTLPDGTVIHEKITPVNGETVSTVNEFATVTSATGAGWVIGEGNDTLTIGVGAVIPDSFFFNAITNRIVASTNMKVGAYTVAAQPLTPGKLTIATVAGATADTQGTISIYGTAVDDTFFTETVTPAAGTTVTTTNIFKSVITVVGAGWVIDAVEGTNDTIIVGTAEVSVPTTNYFSAIQAMADTVVSTQEDVTGATNPALSTLTKIPAGSTVYGKFASITLTSGEAIAYKAAL